jgi:hypothetical protein
MRGAPAGGPLLERSGELARIESALAEARRKGNVSRYRGAGRDRQDGVAGGGAVGGGRWRDAGVSLPWD